MLFRINLTFWDELAHIAFQHVEKGNQIYISGRLVSDTVESDDGKQQTYYKVFFFSFFKQINLVLFLSIIKCGSLFYGQLIPSRL